MGFTYNFNNLPTTVSPTSGLIFFNTNLAIVNSDYFTIKDASSNAPGTLHLWDVIQIKINTTEKIDFTFSLKVTYYNGNTSQTFTTTSSIINEYITLYSNNARLFDQKFTLSFITDIQTPFDFDMKVSFYKKTNPIIGNDTEVKMIEYKSVSKIIPPKNFTVSIDKITQSIFYSGKYYFNFNYSIVKGSGSDPVNGLGTDLYLIENNTTTKILNLIYKTDFNVKPPITPYALYRKNNNNTFIGSYFDNEPSPSITNNLISPNLLKPNTTYTIFLRTSYGINTNNYIESKHITFTTPKYYPEASVHIYSGYYDYNNYFLKEDINNTTQTIETSLLNYKPYIKNIFSISDDKKRSITLNGSYYLFYDTKTFINNDWFDNDNRPSDKPIEFGFYYIDSNIELNKYTDIISNNNKKTKISEKSDILYPPTPTNTNTYDLRAVAFSTTIDNLEPGTTYYFISYMKNGNTQPYYYGEVQSFTTLPINILSYQPPKLADGQNWYQIYDNWESATSTSTNTINPFYRIKSSITDDSRNCPIFYYFKAEFKSEKNYQFRTIVENFYDYKNPTYGVKYNLLKDYKLIGSTFTNFTIKTPWGESNLFPVPYFKNEPSNNLINLFLYSNINSINIPNKPIDNITSDNSSNAKNPITYISNSIFTTVEPNTILNVFNFKSQGLIYTDVNDTDWILQGYAFFNFFNPPNTTLNQTNNNSFETKLVDGKDELISIMDTNNTPIGCKGWHLIEKKNQLVWFDKYIPTGMDETENSRNLPVGGNPDDYYSNKTSEEKWRQNNYVAKYIPYQTFNISFSYYNNSNSKIDMYVGSKLPKFENNTINYFDDYKKIATLDNNTKPNCEFIGLEGNQYIYFVAEHIDFKKTTSPTYSIITLDDFKFAGSYNDGNNILYGITESNSSISTISPINNATYSIKLGTSNNVDSDPNKYNTPITLTSSAGNGTFKAGIWENGVWNNGWRDDTTKKDFYKIDQFFSYNKDKKWQIRISGATSSVTEFSVGDKVTISNIVAIDINDERKLLKNYYTVIEATKNYISVEFETDFPLRRVEIDSDEHRIGVTKNIWLSGIFLNGYFKGIWNNGVFSGYPLITKMDESHWIDGIFNGGHFTAKKYSVKFDNIGNVSYNVDNSKRLGLIFSTPHKLNDNDSIVIYDDEENLVGSTIVLSVIDEMNLITGLTWETVSNFNNLRSGIVHSLISTGLVQNMDFYSNNVSKVSSLTSLRTERVFSYNSWIDVNYSNQSAVNIGKPYYFLEKASNKSYSENNLYGYPTNDILSSNSTFRDSFSVSSRKYKLGKKWKVFNDLVGDSSTFEEYFNTTDTTDGLQLFNTQGWDISLNDKYDTNISINGANSHLGTTMSYFSIYFNNYDYSNTIKEGDLINLNGWKSTNRTDNTAEKNNFIGLTVSYVMTHQIGITASPRFGYATQSLPDTNYTMIGFDNFSEHKNDDIKIKTLATMSYFGEPNGTIGVTNSVGPAYGTQSVNTYTIDLNKSKYMWSLDITLDNTLVFSRTPEPLNTSTSTIGKELKIDSTGDGGILNLIPAYDVSNRTNGGDINTLEKSSYTMIEFDVLQNNSTTNSYLDPNLGNVPIIHFNNLNYITKNFTNAGITYSQTIPTKYLPINTNVNHLSTSGTKKQEFFYNKRNLLMNFKGNGLLGKDRSELFLDNIKMYQVDMIPFFQYFKKSNINISVQIPSNGKSPSINYATDDTTTNIGSTTDTNTIITYFTDSLLIPDTQAPEGVNWITDFGLTSSVI